MTVVTGPLFSLWTFMRGVSHGSGGGGTAVSSALEAGGRTGVRTEASAGSASLGRRWRRICGRARPSPTAAAWPAPCNGLRVFLST